MQKILGEELSYLASVLDRPDISEADLRRSSNTLNMIIVDGGGLLQQLARLKQKKVKVLAPDNRSTLSTLGPDTLAYVCGGVAVCGVILGFVESSRAFTDEEIRDRHAQRSNPDDRLKLSLGHFRNQICIYSQGIPISRETLIKYVANKLGGKHLDERRTGSLGPQFGALDELAVYKISNNALGAVYYELMATGRFLVDSPDVQALIAPA